MISRVEFEGLADCVQIENGRAKLIISTRVGPRILFYGYDEGENILGWHPAAAVETDLGTWRPYGGHRLWVAPENMPLSYSPDNEPVEFKEVEELTASFRTPAGSGYPVEKLMAVSLAADGTTAEIEHTLTNRSDEAIEMAAWALTIMRPGGVVIVPNEPLEGYSPDCLLPVRSMALWSYTDLTDPRWSFTKDSIRFGVDENASGQQKFGVLNKQGWAAYEWSGLRFEKRSEYTDGAVYPDMNSNFEIYTDGGFVEIETLSPLTNLAPGQSLHHKEVWQLFNL